MINKLILIFTILFSSSVFSQSMEDKRNELLQILQEELSEVSRLSKQTSGRNPNLFLRMAEIRLEIARHLKEVENAKYLSLSTKKRQRVNKKSFFVKSTQQFIQAQKTCYFILKRFRKFKGRGDVYYILAFNAKEFQKTKKARGFFQKAIKYSKRGSKTRVRSATALGEILYNEGKFKKAIPLYEMALSKGRSMWWTKDSHNLAWAYFKVGKKTKAIDKMREVYRLSSNKKYVDMSYSVERDLAYFYADTQRISDAIAFFKSNNKSIAKNLVKVSKYLINQGKFTSAEKTLLASIKYQLTDEELVEVNLALMNLYERFGKVSKHLSASKKLVELEKKGKLKDGDRKDLVFHVERKASELQKQAAGKTYARKNNTRKRKANYAAEYYELLISLKPKEDFKYRYYAAEALYASKQYNRAIDLYSKSNEIAKVKKNRKFIKLSNTAILVSLGHKGVRKNTVDKFLIPSYHGYLASDSKSKKANKIFQRLFNAYLAKKDIPKCELTLVEFRKSFPRDQKIQEAMLAKVIDHHRSTKNKARISEWVNKIKKGEFKVSKKYSKRLQYILLTMQFENVEKANTKGDKRKAIQGYVAIYKSEESTKDAKKNAAYNIAVLFYEYGDIKRCYNWLERAFTHMKPSDVSKFSSSIMAMSTSMLNSGYFDEAANTSTLALGKLCSRRSKFKETFYKNAILIKLADHKHESAEEIITKFSKCEIKSKTKMSMELNLVKYYQEKRMWLSYERKLLKLESSRRYWVDLIYPTFLLSKNYKKAARFNLAKEANAKAFKFYKYSKSNGLSISLEALDEVAKIEINNLENEIVRFKEYKLKFPEKTFRSLLQQKLKRLDRLTTKMINVLKIGSGVGISLSYRKLIEIYISIANELNNFELPASKGKEYKAAFKKNMEALSKPLLKKASDFKQEAISKISKQTILTPYNNYFFGGHKDIDIFYFPITNGVLMDRGGQR